jgi:hypothetical protein
LKDREHTCYGESSTTQITTSESEDVPAGVQNEERVIILEKLLLKAGPYVPHLKEQIRAAVRPQAGTDIAEVKYLYEKHVLSNIGSSDVGKIVFNIFSISMSEIDFVEAFRPKGLMQSEAVNAQLSIWNDQCTDTIYLYTYSVLKDLVHGDGSYKFLSRQLAERSKDVELKRVGFFFLSCYFNRFKFILG